MTCQLGEKVVLSLLIYIDLGGISISFTTFILLLSLMIILWNVLAIKVKLGAFVIVVTVLALIGYLKFALILLL